jgi:hypothetical protein
MSALRRQVVELKVHFWLVFVIRQNGPFKKSEAKPFGLVGTNGQHFRTSHKPTMIPSPGNRAMLPGGFEMRTDGGLGMRNGGGFQARTTGGFRMRISGSFRANTQLVASE